MSENEIRELYIEHALKKAKNKPLGEILKDTEFTKEVKEYTANKQLLEQSLIIIS